MDLESDKRRPMRRIDAANISINVTQLVAIIGLVWQAAQCYSYITNRLDTTATHVVQLQSQIGETNSRLSKLEASLHGP